MPRKRRMENRVENIEGQLVQLQQQQTEFAQSLVALMAKQFEELKRELNIGALKGKEKQQSEEESSASEASASKGSNNSTDLERNAKHHEHLRAAVDVVERACHLCVDAQKSLFSCDGKIIEKIDRTLVTATDFGVKALISLKMSKLFPSITLVADEDSGFVRENNLTDAVFAVVVDNSSISDNEKIVTAAMYPEGKVDLWYLEYGEGVEGISWGEFGRLAVGKFPNSEGLEGKVDLWYLEFVEGIEGISCGEFGRLAVGKFSNTERVNFVAQFNQLSDVKSYTLQFEKSKAFMVSENRQLKAIAGCLSDQHAAMVGQACQKDEAKSNYGTRVCILLNTGEEARQSKHDLLSTLAYKLDPKLQPTTL